MQEYLKSTIGIEWVAQTLMRNFKTRGPLISIERDFTESKEFDSLLIFQGSFDPPLLSHYELIHQSISLFQKQFPEAKVALLVLLSLSHVEKGTNLFNRSLLGLRIEMLDSLLSSMTLHVPWMIGLSNSGRYIDLTTAIKYYFKPTYIMGIDVFDKLFQGTYYSEPLTVILPEIFETNYIVAGRDDIVDTDKFDSYIQSLPSETQNMIKETDNIFFLSINSKFQYESATRVRKKLSLGHSTQIPSLHPHTFRFIQDTHLYSNHKTILSIQIIIQIYVRKMIEHNMDLHECVSQTQDFISKIYTDQKVQTRILSEYREGTNDYLEKRCYELLTNST